MAEKLEFPEQQLPGYQLLDRLGAGGYGEVWRATAPGGLPKAVKYVFGRQDETRATHEMKALERIKEVRHPFLLSLERIEVVQGRLIVVTELADESLRDRFATCIHKGLPGIPREELLGYIRDAADALDFLNQSHQLQHLDIKPENLLLLAGHVKVADFGLVKSISNQAQSLVGGMTPTYAAPEVFQGRPSTKSDQYSLAVLYQELLSGTLPFAGGNAAELTLQHLNEEPDLSALPEADRFSLSRALSKDPEYRYDSCSDLVRALAEGGIATESSGGASRSTTRVPRTKARSGSAPILHSATEVFEGDGACADTKLQGPILFEAPPRSNPGIRYAEPPAFDSESFKPSPALFIGIGGSGARVLKTLRQRLTNRFGGPEPLATMPMLLLDTDAKTLFAATRGAEEGDGLRSEETISLPLKRPQEYRSKSGQLLKWLGRRWMYNIPRTLQTEGIRPLGRLALVDHARQTFQRIRLAMSECVAAESLAQAEERTGLAFDRNRMRVYVCASISGGAGSGMMIDVAYAVKSILKRLDIQDARVIGVLNHSTSRDTQRGELARVNAYSWLREFQHFSRPGSAYPGDDSCGLPPHEAGQLAFDATYLTYLGAGLDSSQYEEQLDKIADYLYLDAATPARNFLDACRADTHDAADPRTLRTFALRHNAAANPETLRRAEESLRNDLIDSWLGDSNAAGPTESATDVVVPGGAELVERLKLEAAGLASLCRGLLEAQRGSPAGSGAMDSVARDTGQSIANFDDLAAPVLALFPDPAGTTSGDASTGPPSQVTGPLHAKMAAAIRHWILGQVNREDSPIKAARQAQVWVAGRLAEVESNAERLAAMATDAKAEVEAQLRAFDWPSADQGQVQATRIRLLKIFTEIHAIESARQLVHDLRCDAIDTAGPIENLAASLSKLRGTTPANPDSAAAGDWDPATRKKLDHALTELKGRLLEEILPEQGGFAAIARDQETLARFGSALQDAVEHAANRALTAGPGWDLQADAFDCPEPAIAESGATCRRFAVRPAELLAEANAEPCSWPTIPAGQGDSFQIIEAEDLSLPHVAAEIVGRRRDYADLAERVHTRQDIRWTDPLELFEEAPPIAGEALAEAVHTEAVVPIN